MSGKIHRQTCPHCNKGADALKSSPTHNWICSDCVDRLMNRGEHVELDSPTPPGNSEASFLLSGSVSGRLSSNRPNYNNIPRDAVPKPVDDEVTKPIEVNEDSI